LTYNLLTIKIDLESAKMNEHAECL